ncbi:MULTISPECIES: hypothetical protein [unclassified Paenibacillus]|uniref:hypothetical protein n=1 Tax=unclassified Paenibacillus TaxID=185978 RepID=UPI00363C72D4
MNNSVELTEDMVAKLERIDELVSVVSKAAGQVHQVRFASRWPAECAELRNVAADIRAYGPEFGRLSFRLARIIDEMDETWRVHQDNRLDSRQARKQRDLLAGCFIKLVEATEALHDVATVDGRSVRNCHTT